MARQRTGGLFFKAGSWYGRWTAEVDGERVRVTRNLGTASKAAARRKLTRLVAEATGERVEVERSETFREAAERIVGESGIRYKHMRLARLRLHVFPAIGDQPVDKITASDVRDILVARAEAGGSKETVTKLRNDVGAVLGELWRLDVLPENVCKKVRVPKIAKVDNRERAVLTDDELARYLAWQHPDPHFRGAVLERQTMGCIARMFGGLRLGDLKAIRWESFDIGEGTFETGRAPRQKTARAQLLEVPDMLRPILRDWWERAGRPSSGFMFPVRRGQRAGEGKQSGSPAKALRRDLARAFGVEEPVAERYMRSNGRPGVRYTWRAAREMTPRERELFSETEYTRPVDFHSFRRAYKQALADAGVELQTAMALSGATDAKAHQRYLRNTAKSRRLPAAALPRLGIGSPGSHSGALSGAGEGIRTLDVNLGKVALYH